MFLQLLLVLLLFGINHFARGSPRNRIFKLFQSSPAPAGCLFFNWRKIHSLKFPLTGALRISAARCPNYSNCCPAVRSPPAAPHLNARTVTQSMFAWANRSLVAEGTSEGWGLITPTGFKAPFLLWLNTVRKVPKGKNGKVILNDLHQPDQRVEQEQQHHRSSRAPFSDINSKQLIKLKNH